MAFLLLHPRGQSGMHIELWSPDKKAWLLKSQAKQAQKVIV